MQLKRLHKLTSYIYNQMFHINGLLVYSESGLKVEQI